MALSEAEAAVTYIHDVIVKGRDVHHLRYVWREIQNDYDDRGDFIKRYCNSADQLETFLKDYPHLLIVENKKVARSTEELESGLEKADMFFENEMLCHAGPVKIEIVKKQIEHAPSDVKKFIEAFYPYGEFRRYLQGRPYSFFVSTTEGTVNLAKSESVAYFHKVAKMFKTLPFTSLRGHIGQAPAHVKEYINARFPGTEFRHFLEENHHAFELHDGGFVTAVH